MPALFELFSQYEGTLAAMQLVLAMLGMGATLQVSDFRQIGSRPHSLVIVLIAQYLLFPICAVLLARLLALPPGVALGLLVLTVMPSGALSNLFTYLGKGNVALSIASTLASMLTCLLVTPLVLAWLGSATLPGGFRVPTRDVVEGIVYFLLLPLIAGMIVRRLYSAGHLGLCCHLERGRRPKSRDLADCCGATFGWMQNTLEQCLMHTAAALGSVWPSTQIPR